MTGAWDLLRRAPDLLTPGPLKRASEELVSCVFMEQHHRGDQTNPLIKELLSRCTLVET